MVVVNALVNWKKSTTPLPNNPQALDILNFYLVKPPSTEQAKMAFKFPTLGFNAPAPGI